MRRTIMCLLHRHRLLLGVSLLIGYLVLLRKGGGSRNQCSSPMSLCRYGKKRTKNLNAHDLHHCQYTGLAWHLSRYHGVAWRDLHPSTTGFYWEAIGSEAIHGDETWAPDAFPAWHHWDDSICSATTVIFWFLETSLCCVLLEHFYLIQGLFITVLYFIICLN